MFYTPVYPFVFSIPCVGTMMKMHFCGWEHVGTVHFFFVQVNGQICTVTHSNIYICIIGSITSKWPLMTVVWLVSLNKKFFQGTMTLTTLDCIYKLTHLHSSDFLIIKEHSDQNVYHSGWFLLLLFSSFQKFTYVI